MIVIIRMPLITQRHFSTRHDWSHEVAKPELCNYYLGSVFEKEFFLCSSLFGNNISISELFFASVNFSVFA